MASIFQTNEITQGGLRLIAEATSANPIVYTKALSASQIPQDPEIENFYNGIEGEIDASAATDNVARVVALYGNNITDQPQDVKAIAIMGRLSSQSDSQAVIFAYCYDADSLIKFPSLTAPAQRTRFAFNFAFDQVENVSVTEVGSASLADLHRLVSCHKAGNPEAGEDQTILGDKTWEDQQDFNEACRFHDTISTHNVYPDGNNYNLGSAQAEYNNVFAAYGNFSTRVQTQSVLLATGSVRAERVNARSELDIKGITIIGKTRLESDYYTYELQVHGGDKYETPQTGVCGRLDILPTITVIDPSSGDATDYTAEINMGNAAHRLSEIYAMRVNQKSLVLQPVDGTLDDATMFYAEKVPEPGDESGRYYDYTMYIKTPETPMGESWEYAIAPYQNWVDLGYASKPFYSLYLESGIVLGSTTNNDGGIRLRAERTNAETQGHYDLNLDIWMACGANTHTWDNFNITPWTGSIAQKINLGTEDRPFSKLWCSQGIEFVLDNPEQTSNYPLIRCQYYTVDPSSGETETLHSYASSRDLMFVDLNQPFGGEPNTVDGYKVKFKTLNATVNGTSLTQPSYSLDLRRPSQITDAQTTPEHSTTTMSQVPIGAIIYAMIPLGWANKPNTVEVVPAGSTITVREDHDSSSQDQFIWYAAVLHTNNGNQQTVWKETSSTTGSTTNGKEKLPAGKYRTLCRIIRGNGTLSAAPTEPILLQRIS